MAKTSEVQVGLDAIAQAINDSRNRLSRVKVVIDQEESMLASLPATYTRVVTEINNNDTPTGPVEELAKDLLEKLTTDFTALKDAATAAKTALAIITEF